MEKVFDLSTEFGLSQGDWLKYKIHIAHNNGSVEPFNVARDGFQEWVSWNRWRGNRGNNDFNRPYIFSLIPIPESSGKYVFGGIFKVIKRHDDWKETGIGYDLELDEKTKSLIGRVIVEYHRKQGQGGRSFKMENHIERMTLMAIIDKPFGGISPQK